MPETTDLNGIATEVATRARDAAYVAVGLGVLGLQRARAGRHDLAARVAQAGDRDERIAQLRATVTDGTRQLVEWLDATTQTVAASLAPLEAQLPDPAREVAGKARTQLSTAVTQLRQAVSPGT